MSREVPLLPGDPQGSDAREHFNPSIMNRLFQPFRKIISQKRCRFKYEGIDLDLAYITDRIIAVGYPSEGWEKYLRNTMGHTLEFLRRRHGLDRVKVFNLRGGFFYDPRKFENNVITFDMTDHHPPRLELMAPFCREAIEWLKEDSRNVIAVHCKAGKGRTGVMICALLVYMQFYDNPRKILDYYSIVRTQNNKGVTIPSQRRYIYYYNHLRQKELNYFPLRMQLVGVYVERPPATTRNGAKIHIKVANESTIVFNPPVLNILGDSWRSEMNAWRDASSENPDETLVSRRAYCFMVPQNSPVFVEGDVRVDLLAYGSRDPKIGHVWFNTMFTCPGSWSDNACGHKPEDFVYGDRAYPYAEGETSIGKKTFRNGEEMLEVCDETDTDGWKIEKPPKLDEHAPFDSIENIYLKNGMVPPRYDISSSLYSAHKKGIVRDDYNIRERKAKGSGQPVEIVSNSLGAGTAGTAGPVFVRKEKDQHVLSFPVYEMDRALKNEKLHDGLKIHVVLKCVDSSNQVLHNQSVAFCNTTFANENRRDRAPTVRGSYRTWRCDKPSDAVGAELRDPPAIRYASSDGHFNGRANANLRDDRFKHDRRAKSPRWCRYFYKQLPDNRSPSKYPGKHHECPLTEKTFDIDKDREDGDNDDEKPEPTSAQKLGSYSKLPESSDGKSNPSGSSATPGTPGGSSKPKTAPLAQEEDMTIEDEQIEAVKNAQRDLRKHYPENFVPSLSQDYQKDLESIYFTSEKFRPFEHLTYDLNIIEDKEVRDEVAKNMVTRGIVIGRNTKSLEPDDSFPDNIDHLSSILDTLKLDRKENNSKKSTREMFEKSVKITTIEDNYSKQLKEPNIEDKAYLEKFCKKEEERLNKLHRGSDMYQTAISLQSSWPKADKKLNRWKQELLKFYTVEELNSCTDDLKRKAWEQLQELLGSTTPELTLEDVETMAKKHEEKWKRTLSKDEEETSESMYRQQCTNSNIPLYV